MREADPHENYEGLEFQASGLASNNRLPNSLISDTANNTNGNTHPSPAEIRWGGSTSLKLKKFGFVDVLFPLSK